jgi:hypothetical protein
MSECFAKAVEQLGAVDKDGRKPLEPHFGGITDWSESPATHRMTTAR